MIPSKVLPEQWYLDAMAQIRGLRILLRSKGLTDSQIDHYMELLAEGRTDDEAWVGFSWTPVFQRSAVPKVLAPR